MNRYIESCQNTVLNCENLAIYQLALFPIEQVDPVGYNIGGATTN